MVYRLQEGSRAPELNTTDVQGGDVRLDNMKGKVMLSFYRYASCPFCNIRMHEIISRYDECKSVNLECIAIFESPRESIIKYVGKQDMPFPVIADPEQTLYKKYCVTGSVWGFFKGSLSLRRLAQALAQGFFPGKMEGDKFMLPADFLIDSQGVIARAYYGNSISDHIPLSDVFAWTKSQGG